LEKDENCKINDLEELIEQLPEHFPAAAGEIKTVIVPILADLEKGVIDHYTEMIKKHTKAASKKAVSSLIDEGILEYYMASSDSGCQTEDPDPEIIKAAQQIARDPQLFLKKIDTVNKLGVAGERKNIAINLLTIDSRLIPLKNGKPENLGLKNSGHQGSGKSNQMTKSLKLYPETAYTILSNVSPKGLLMMEDHLKHKAVIFSEGKAFESHGKKDPEPAYVVRSLLSEGFYHYTRQVRCSEGLCTETLKLEGPVSLLTTTIRQGLEKQLDDRIFTIHTDTTADQTRRVLEQVAAEATGVECGVEDTVIQAWQHYHDSLENIQVIIPFAEELTKKLPEHPPIAARRAFTRVLSAIKTMTILYQKLRETDNRGRLIAKYADYAMAYQIVESSFAESLKGETATTDKRIRLIEEERMISPKAFAEKTGVTSSTVSEWIKSAVQKGLISWCNENGEELDDINAINKARYTGKGYVRLASGKSLPTPYELTGDSRWDKGGDLYALYDLHLDAEGPVMGNHLRLIVDNEPGDGEIAETWAFTDEMPDKATMH